MRSRTAKLQELEKNRWSVFTDELKSCYFCKKPSAEIHEILYGAKRTQSMKWGLCLPLCHEHHMSMHKNHKLTLLWQIKCQEYFVEKYSYEDWMKIFHCDYKYKLRKREEDENG